MMSARSAAAVLLFFALAVVASQRCIAVGSGATALLMVPASRSDVPKAALYVRGSGNWTKIADVEARRAAWSPDGRHIALSQDDVGPIWLVTVKAGEVRQLASAASSPAWSPDGKALAFVRSGGGIAIAAAPTWSVRDVQGTERGYAPAWKPDGRTLAFARSVGGSGSVWQITIGEAAAERVAVCARPLALAWSPDGARIAVIEHDADRMASPRLSLLEREQPAPAVVCDVKATAAVWIADHRLLVHDMDRTCAVIEVSSGPAGSRKVMRAGEHDLFAGSNNGHPAFVTLDAGRRPVGLRLGEAAKDVPLPTLPSGLAAAAASWTPSSMPAVETAASTGDALIQRVGDIGEPDRPRVSVLADDGVVSPMVFPVCGQVVWSDTFGHPRGATRRHAGQDIMAPKMRPVVAAFDGVVTLRRPNGPGGHYWLTLTGDNGWTATYLHLNNDTPGTDDGLGTDEHAFAAGLTSGSRVRAGQHLGFVGDSGNAEGTAPHLHFELAPTATRIPINPGPSLEAALRLDEPRAVSGDLPVQPIDPLPPRRQPPKRSEPLAAQSRISL